MAELFSTREAIISASRRPVKCFIKALGGEVFLRPMSGAERLQFREAISSMGETATDIDIRRRIQEPAMASGLVDESGSPLFAVENVAQLGNAAIDEICGELLRISGMQSSATGEAEKNSLPTPSGASVSG